CTTYLGLEPQTASLHVYRGIMNGLEPMPGKLSLTVFCSTFRRALSAKLSSTPLCRCRIATELLSHLS
ncbi:MAG: hypothetical protein AVDCRST_MAG86-2836, partial [uncultured Truepera sp.]